MMKRGHVNGVPSFCCMLDATNFFQLLPLDLVKLPYTICGAEVFLSIHSFSSIILGRKVLDNISGDIIFMFWINVLRMPYTKVFQRIMLSYI